MKEYTPSAQFVADVMNSVERLHARRQRQRQTVEDLLRSPPLRIVFSLAAAVCGVWNVVRIYLVLLSPVICS